MLLIQISVSIGILLLFRLFFWPASKKWLLFILSILALFWFQTPSAIRLLRFWLPTTVLLISTLVWRLSLHKSNPLKREDKISLVLILGTPVIINSIKVIGFLEIAFISSLSKICALVAIFAVFYILIFYIGNKASEKPYFPVMVIIILITVLVILKSPVIGKSASFIIRRLNNQTTTLASSLDLSWVGFSYFAFRLIHTLIDRKRIRELSLNLNEFVTYLVFFPAWTAGPIDRVEHYHGELTKEYENSLEDDFLYGGYRIFRGIALKFIFADSLAIISLNSQTASTMTKTGWMWVMVYAFAFRIYFDFAGYTDIAIGMARLAGINLPENFNRPYLSKNITLFWNNWHITLTKWFRTYYFNPLVRFLKTSQKNISPTITLLFAQISTMLLVGLWHGITWNFVIWGLWNGIALFLHNRWSEKIEPKICFIKKGTLSVIYRLAGTILTFNIIALGWVWFALPSLEESILVFYQLFLIK